MGTASREFEGCGLWRLMAWKLSKKKAKTQDSLKIVLEPELVARPDKPQAIRKTFTFEALTTYLELSFPSPLKSEFPISSRRRQSELPLNLKRHPSIPLPHHQKNRKSRRQRMLEDSWVPQGGERIRLVRLFEVLLTGVDTGSWRASK